MDPSFSFQTSATVVKDGSFLYLTRRRGEHVQPGDLLVPTLELSPSMPGHPDNGKEITHWMNAEIYNVNVIFVLNSRNVNDGSGKLTDR